jgi:hypothetical protein
MPGRRVEFEIDASARLFGTQQYLGVRFTLPQAGDSVGRPQPAAAFGERPSAGNADATTQGSLLDVFPGAGFGWYGQTHTADNLAHSQWIVDGVNKWFRVCGSYSLA